MRKQYIIFTAVFIGFASLLNSCGEDIPQEDKPVTKSEVDADILDVEVEDYNPQMSYQVPTPNELFAVIGELGLSFNPDLMNPTENTDNYSDNISQALNLGVYFADMAFDGNMNEGKNTISYLKSVMKLATALKIDNAFDQAIVDKIGDPNQNKDSLMTLSNDTYFEAYSYLEENQRGATLSMIIIGGWVESLYLLTNSGEFEEESAFSSRLAEQKLTMENLMGYLMKYQDDEDVMMLMEELIPLDEFFMNLEVVEGDAVGTTQEEGVYVLTGGSEVKMSEGDYGTLKTLVSDLRSDIINGDI